MQDAARSAALALVAEEVGAADVFVFRRLAGGRFAHLGGAGRGEGWAGIVEVDPNDDTIVREALDRNAPVGHSTSEVRWVFGPYYAASAVAVPVSADTVVVFGHSRHALPLRDEHALREAGERAAGLIHDVAVAKRLADELEVLEALRKLADSPPGDLVATLQHVVDTAAEALSCELGALYLRQPELVVYANRGWPLDADHGLILDAMRSLDPRAGECPLCVQEASSPPLPRPFSAEAGIRSYYLLELGPTAQGMLLLMHTDAVPRGFTLLCRELGLRLVEAADTVISASVQRTQLELEIERLSAAARRDPLTGLANRLAWEEAVAAAQRRCDGGDPASVIVLDLDHLKRANDERGHACGDDLLRALGGVMRATTRERDTVARLGGDEVGVLLHGADEAVCAEVVRRIETAINSHRAVSGIRLSAALGSATCPPGGSLAETFEAADRQMYEAKAGGRRMSA
jgi:diguanylate cyclase (GGDEF)-like protein